MEFAVALSVNELKNKVDDWLQPEAGRFFPEIAEVDGGWEVWAQVDFAGWLARKDERDYDILREQYVYDTSGMRCDWLINWNTAGATPIIVELKAQSASVQDTSFINSVSDDLTKLTGKLKPAYQAKTPSRLAMVFVRAKNDTVEDALIKMEFSLKPRPGYPRLYFRNFGIK